MDAAILRSLKHLPEAEAGCRGGGGAENAARDCAISTLRLCRGEYSNADSRSGLTGHVLFFSTDFVQLFGGMMSIRRRGRGQHAPPLFGGMAESDDLGRHRHLGVDFTSMQYLFMAAVDAATDAYPGLHWKDFPGNEKVPGGRGTATCRSDLGSRSGPQQAPADHRASDRSGDPGITAGGQKPRSWRVGGSHPRAL